MNFEIFNSFPLWLGIGQKKKSCHLRAGLLKKTAATYSPEFAFSTIGAEGLNFSVRNGKRWSPLAIAT